MEQVQGAIKIKLEKESDCRIRIEDTQIFSLVEDEIHTKAAEMKDVVIKASSF